MQKTSFLSRKSVRRTALTIAIAIATLTAAPFLFSQDDWRPLVADKRYNEAARLLAASLGAAESDEAALKLSEICRYITQWEPVLPHIKPLPTREKLSDKQIDLLANVCLFASPNQERLLDDLIDRVGIEKLPLGSLSKAVMACETFGSFEKARRYDAVRRTSWQRLIEEHKSLDDSAQRKVQEQFREDPSDTHLEALLYQTYCSVMAKEMDKVAELVVLLLAKRPDSPVVQSLAADHRLRTGQAAVGLVHAMKAWDKSDVRALPLIVEALIAMKNRAGLRPLIDDLVRFRQAHPMIPFALARFVSSAPRIEDERELFLRAFRGLNRDLVDENPTLRELMEECMKDLKLDYSDLRLVGAR